MKGGLKATYGGRKQHCVSLRNAKMTMLPCCYVTPLLLSNELMIRIPNPEEEWYFLSAVLPGVAFAALAARACFSGMRVTLVSSRSVRCNYAAEALSDNIHP